MYPTIQSIVLIPSLVDCPMSRSVFTRSQRFEQTKQTIQTVRDKIPNCFIMLVDCSVLSNLERTYFAQHVNVLLNGREDQAKTQETESQIYHMNKSCGERHMFMLAFRFLFGQLHLFPKLQYFFKISGRYWLDDNFNFANFDNQLDVIRTVDPKLWANACDGSLYKIMIHNLPFYRLLLETYKQQFDQGLSYEHFLFDYVHFMDNKALSLPVLGCGGLIAINGSEGHC